MNQFPAYRHTRSDGSVVECRRSRPGRAGILDVEARVLRPDGMPFDEVWYPLSDEGFVLLSLCDPEIPKVMRGGDHPSVRR